MTFRRIVSSDITVDLLRTLVKFCVDYIESSGDSSLMPMQVACLAEQAAFKADSPYQFWLLYKGETLAGYAITEYVQSDAGLDLNISQAYIASDYRGNGVQPLTIGEFEKFAKDEGCNFLTASTRRGSPEAYIRWMAKCGFTKRCVIVEKDLRSGVN